MGKKESVPNRQYTDEFKVEAIRLAESIGGNRPRSVVCPFWYVPVPPSHAGSCLGEICVLAVNHHGADLAPLPARILRRAADKTCASPSGWR